MTQRIGLLGGTFDPPHIGHLILGEYALDALDLDRVLFVPAAIPPHKQGEVLVETRHRLGMLECAIADNPHFGISRVDVDRPGPHYSIDMLRLLTAEFRGAELYFIMGGDSLRDLPNWTHADEIIRLCRLAVMQRPGAQVTAEMHEGVLPGISQRVTLMDAPLIEISSSNIADRLAHRRSVRYLVPDVVLDYMHQHRLYETTGET